MRFNLKKPCKDCPFLRGSSTNISLEEGRLSGIIDSIRDDFSFTCHKTIYSDNEDVEEQHCAGAMIFLEKENKPNQYMRVAERLGLYDKAKLDMNVDIIDDIKLK